MGVPAQKHLTIGNIPENFEEKESGVLQKDNKVWSTSEAKFIDASKFPYCIGDKVDNFYGVIRKV